MACGPRGHDRAASGAAGLLARRPLVVSAMNSRPPRGSAFPARLPATGTAAAKAPSAVADRVLRPQRLLHEAAADLARQRVPAGVGLDSDQVRQRMVRRLQSQGVEHPAVLDAMGRVPRHRFVDSALVTQAYEDTSLPIGLGQTISKPIVVGRMLQLLATRPGAPAERPLGHVLEIGTGCGYQAALLALLARRVVSIERLKPLHERARAHLDATGARDIRLVWGDGRLGHAPLAPYDTIVAAAGGRNSHRPGWINWRRAGVWWRPCTAPNTAVKCWSWSSATARAGAAACMVEFISCRWHRGLHEGRQALGDDGAVEQWAGFGRAGVAAVGLRLVHRDGPRRRPPARRARARARADACQGAGGPSATPGRRRAGDAGAPAAWMAERRQARALHGAQRRRPDAHRAGTRPELA